MTESEIHKAIMVCAQVLDSLPGKQDAMVVLANLVRGLALTSNSPQHTIQVIANAASVSLALDISRAPSGESVH